MHASCQKSTALHSVRFAELSTMQRRCGMVWGRAILAATTNKKMNAPARIMAPAKQSSAATIRNNQRPYHRTGENRRIVTKHHKTPECSNGYREKGCKHGRRNNRLFFILYTFKRGLILYSLFSRHAINSLLLTTTKCNQFFILYSFKVQLILYCLQL
jgi:hypothetical protein